MRTFAQDLFDKRIALDKAEDDLTSHVLRILNTTIDGRMRFEDSRYDWYDHSFELDGCEASLVLSSEQQDEFWKLGFLCGWLNYSDKTERHYWRDSTIMGYPNGSLKDAHGNFLNSRVTNSEAQPAHSAETELRQA